VSAEVPLYAQIYLQRLGVDLSNSETVRLTAGCAFALATQALAELPILQFPPSLTAAAVLVAARKAQVPPPPHTTTSSITFIARCSVVPVMKSAPMTRGHRAAGFVLSCCSMLAVECDPPSRHRHPGILGGSLPHPYLPLPMPSHPSPNMPKKMSGVRQGSPKKPLPCPPQGSVPFWPSVLSQLTGFTEASTPVFASAIGHAERLCTKLCAPPEAPYAMGGPQATMGGSQGIVGGHPVPGGPPFHP